MACCARAPKCRKNRACHPESGAWVLQGSENRSATWERRRLDTSATEPRAKKRWRSKSTTEERICRRFSSETSAGRGLYHPRLALLLVEHLLTSPRRGVKEFSQALSEAPG